VKGFPTPTSLLEAQRRYSKSKKSTKNDGNAPEPFPPPSLKADIYNVADYADIDAHASKVSTSQSHIESLSALSSLASVLTSLLHLLFQHKSASFIFLFRKIRLNIILWTTGLRVIGIVLVGYVSHEILLLITRTTLAVNDKNFKPRRLYKD